MLLYERERALVRDAPGGGGSTPFPGLTATFGLFQAVLGRPSRPVHLVAPGHIMTWLQQYHEQCQEILQHFR